MDPALDQVWRSRRRGTPLDGSVYRLRAGSDAVRRLPCQATLKMVKNVVLARTPRARASGSARAGMRAGSPSTTTVDGKSRAATSTCSPDRFVRADEGRGRDEGWGRARARDRLR